MLSLSFDVLLMAKYPLGTYLGRKLIFIIKHSLNHCKIKACVYVYVPVCAFSVKSQKQGLLLFNV